MAKVKANIIKSIPFSTGEFIDVVEEIRPDSTRINLYWRFGDFGDDCETTIIPEPEKFYRALGDALAVKNPPNKNLS